tara:strand:- start:351 stop:617 length:267 start_codon:yes stop_codon:yes gene_type:complete
VLIKLKLGSIPTIKKNISDLLNLVKNPVLIVKKLIFFVKNKVENIIAKKYFFYYLSFGGIKSMQGINNKNTSIIKAHNLDYDFFIKEK